MKSYEGMPEKYLPPQDPPIEIFIPLAEAQAGKTESITFRTTDEQIRNLATFAEIDRTNPMDQVRGAVEAYLFLVFDRTAYYDFPVVEHFPENKEKALMHGRLPMAQLWQLARLAGINTPGSLPRRDLIIMSATELYTKRRLDNVFTLNAFLKATEERRLLLHHLSETLDNRET